MVSPKSLLIALPIAVLSISAHAEPFIGRHQKLHHHQKRDLESCTKDMANLAFQTSPSRDNTTAAICYNAGYTVDDKSETHFRAELTHACYTSRWLIGPKKHEYTCFYLLGKNKFTANGDGGYQNLAIQSAPGKCTWDSGMKTLDCQA